MAVLPEISEFTAGIYQLEITDPVEGGADGISNQQAKELANRTLWLKQELEKGEWLTGDVKEVDCTEAYIAANFDVTGLGINERLGWAICNGNNGTRDRGGRVGLAYGTGYTSMGATGGSKDAVVVQHSHTVPPLDITLPRSEADSGEVDGNKVLMSDVQAAGSFTFNDATPNTLTNQTGVSGTDKNLQPYIISLFIQKI